MKTFDTFETPDGLTQCKKRPVVVKAIQIGEPFRVNSLEGDYKQGKPGDYLIKGIDGENYICDKDIFEKTYDFIDTNEDKQMTSKLKQLVQEAKQTNEDKKILVRNTDSGSIYEINKSSFDPSKHDAIDNERCTNKPGLSKDFPKAKKAEEPKQLELPVKKNLPDFISKGSDAAKMKVEPSTHVELGDINAKLRMVTAVIDGTSKSTHNPYKDKSFTELQKIKQSLLARKEQLSKVINTPKPAKSNKEVELDRVLKELAKARQRATKDSIAYKELTTKMADVYKQKDNLK